MRFMKFYSPLAIVLLLASCSVEKRLHTGGYHVEWYSLNKNSNHQIESPEVKKQVNPASIETSIALEEPKTIGVLPTETAEVLPAETTQLPTESAQLVEIKCSDKANKVNSKADRKTIKEYVANRKQSFSSTTGSVSLAQEGEKSQGLGVAGMVCGIIGLVFCWVPFFGFILSLLGCIFGGVQLAKIKKDSSKYGGKGQAVTGLVLGIVGLAIGIILTSLIFAAAATIAGA